MVCFLGHCEVIVLEGRQGLVTPQLVILQRGLILERSVFQKCGSATIGPIFKYFLLSPSFNSEELVERKNIHSMLHVLLRSCVSVSSSYALRFPFLRSCDQNLSSGSACCPQWLSLTRLISAAGRASVLAYLRESPSAWLGTLMLVLQRRGQTCRANGSSHVPPVAWEPKRGQCSLALGEVRRVSWPLQLVCLEGAVWGVSHELGHRETPPSQRRFTALGIVKDRDSWTRSPLS